MINTILQGDALELAKSLPDNSIDLIFTDPPYLKEYLPLYEWLSEASARLLKPNGFLLTYSGGYWKDKVMEHLGRHLDYFWDYTMVMHDSSMMWPRKTIARAKSLLCYRPKGGKGLPNTNVLGLFDGGTKDKRFHQWGQDEQTARYYIECFSRINDIVLEPFTGGGTTLIVCKALGRNFIGFEIDPVTVEIAKTRIAGINQYVPKTQPHLFTLEQV